MSYSDPLPPAKALNWFCFVLSLLFHFSSAFRCSAILVGLFTASIDCSIFERGVQNLGDIMLSLLYLYPIIIISLPGRLVGDNGALWFVDQFSNGESVIR